mmetsp:Transcript_10572/g.17482  ORF Transcript_10572/g.17482 Transcript_10572/m.17482 type:complete len:203 (-) Transcript_10572:10-618(-)
MTGIYPLMDALGVLDVVDVLKDRMIVELKEENEDLKELKWLHICKSGTNNVIARGRFREDMWSAPHIWTSWGGVVPSPGRCYQEKDLLVPLETVRAVDNSGIDGDEFVFDIRTNGIIFTRSSGEYAISPDRPDSYQLDCYLGEYYPENDDTVNVAMVGTLFVEVEGGLVLFKSLHLIERWNQEVDLIESWTQEVTVEGEFIP